MRDLLAEELAKGVDAAWRMSADSAVQDFRARLASFVQVCLTFANAFWHIDEQEAALF